MLVTLPFYKQERHTFHCDSSTQFYEYLHVALVAQWIARWIPNPKVRGSNPRWGMCFVDLLGPGVDLKIRLVRSGVRTHAHKCVPELKSGALDRSAILTTHHNII